MGIELLLAGAGTAVAIPACWKLIDILIKEFFRNTNALRESDKASRVTIDNHIDHNTESLNALTESNSRVLKHLVEQDKKRQEYREERQEYRKELINAIVSSTEASTKQVITNKLVLEALEKLTEKIV